MSDIAISTEFQSGLDLAKLAMMEIETQNETARSGGVELNIAVASAILNKGLCLPDEARDGFVSALAEFIGLALDGCVIIPSRWKPLT